MIHSDRQNKRPRTDCGRAFFFDAVVLPGPVEHLIFWGLTAVGLAADLWSKHAVFQWLGGRGSFSVIDGVVSLVTTVNAGAAFGLAAGRRYLLVAVSIVALAAILVIFFCSGRQSRLVHIALAFFTAGICGNLYDRLFNDGLVRDFIDVVYWPGKHWPAFNIADSMLCAAVGIMLLRSVFTGQSGRVHVQQQK